MTSAVVSRGRRGTLATFTVVLRGRRGTYETGMVLGPVTLRDAAVLCVAGVALGDIRRRFTWQVWHLQRPPSFCVAGAVLIWDWDGSGDALGSPLMPRDAAALCVAGVALGDIRRRFTWQAWHLATFTVVLRGRRGTYETGMVLGPVTLRDAAVLCVAGVALGDIRRRFTWQVWHLQRPPSFCVAGAVLIWDWDGSGDALGSPLMPRDAAALCVAGVALGDIRRRFTWQAWHLATSTFVLRGRRSTSGTGIGLVTTLSHTIFHTHLCHTHTQLCHTPSFTHIFVIYHLSYTTLSHTIFHTHLCHIPSFIHNVVTHHLPHTSLSHTIFHTHLGYTSSFTHNFVTHHLSHISLLHTIFHTQLCHTPSFTHNLFTYNLFTHRSSTTSLVYPAFPIPLQLCVLIMEEVDL